MFSSEVLENSFENCRETIGGISTGLSEVDQEISIIQDALASYSSALYDFKYPICGEQFCYENILSYDGTPLLVAVQEQLQWNNRDKKIKYSRREVVIENDTISNTNKEVLEAFQLREWNTYDLVTCSFLTRQRMHAFLDKLIDGIVEKSKELNETNELYFKNRNQCTIGLTPSKASQSQHINFENLKETLAVEKPETRRLGFDFPDYLLNDFKVATRMNKTTMTATIIRWMEDYCENIKQKRGLDRLSEA